MTDRTVTLIDGRVVSSSSEEFRHECEARHIARMPTREQRHAQLDRVEKVRGRDARRALQKLAQQIFYAERSAQQEQS